ncbi:DNA polymerase [Gordonia jacobaea]|uniref:DNA polymerase n=1 Tax=Gordonia jacobaea TaxID=122202 RepID=UPI0022E75B5D|nr:DNA polymerase [Gordonia jacobaea]
MSIYLDYETRLRGGDDRYLKDHGPYLYTEHSDFEATLLAFRVGDGATHVIEGAEAIRHVTRFLVAYADHTGRKLVAHNASFDRLVASRVLGMPTGQYLDPAGWDDTLPRARLLGYPGNLAWLAEALGAPAKLEEGKDLIRLFGSADAPLKEIIAAHPAEWAQFVAYARRDVDALAYIDPLLRWPREEERRAWVLDQRVNDRGIEVDRAYCTAADIAARAAQQRDIDRLIEITGVDNPRSVPQLKAWFASRGFNPPNLQRETLEKHLPVDLEQAEWLKEHKDRGDLSADVLEVIRIKTAGGVVSRWQKMLDWTCSDGRIRGAYVFATAHTGRWSSRGAQLHNMSRDSVGETDAEVEEFVQRITTDPEGVELSLRDMRGGLRPALVGPFTVVDFSAIEARVLAWLTGEDDIVELFDRGEDVYVDAARKIGLTVPDKAVDPVAYKAVRGQGKVMTLAAGYGGGPATLRAQGAVGTDAEIKAMSTAWKRARRPVTRLWRDLERGLTCPVRRLRGVSMRRGDNRSREMILPSGRTLRYARVRETAKGDHVYTKPHGGVGKLWGGTLTNNLCQAVARDLLVEALLRLDAAGYTVVGHVHDEVIIAGHHDVDLVVKLMCQLPRWAAGLPLDAEGYQCDRYRKE